MSSPSKSSTKTPTSQSRGVLHALASQSGAFSPFMFGLIMGVTIFSAVSLQYAKQRLVEIQKQKTVRARAQAEDMAKAMDFSILSETKETYNDEYSLARAKQFASTAGKTQGDQDFQVSSQQTDKQSFGRQEEKVAITATDDSILRSQIYRTSDEKELDKVAMNATQPVAVYDTSMARDQQIRTSNVNMENLAEQVYAYYAAKLKFPMEDEFDTLQSRLALHDAWGANFDYKVSADGQEAHLSFTTPWNYTRDIKLSLKDGPESGK